MAHNHSQIYTVLNVGRIMVLYKICIISLTTLLLVVIEAPNFWDNLEEVLQMYFYYFYLQTHILSLQAHILNIPKNVHNRLLHWLHITGNIEIGRLVISKCFFVQVCLRLVLQISVAGSYVVVLLVKC